MSVSVQLNHITKAFDTMLAVNDISLTIAPVNYFSCLDHLDVENQHCSA